MAKEQITTGLSREFIIHPGETLKEILNDKEMSQKELAIRAGFTEKHVNTIINGNKPISISFAKKLEYVFGIDASFWINLQNNYDLEMLEFSELNQISKEEMIILKSLKSITEYFGCLGLMNNDANEQSKILDLRKILNVSNLDIIPKISYPASYRAQLTNNVNLDIYVLYAWQKLCEILTSHIETKMKLDIEKLKTKIIEIKQYMFSRVDKIEVALTKIFAECGITFKIVKHFTGAPVQGFIKVCDNERMILCMTLKKASDDIFWFTIF